MLLVASWFRHATYRSTSYDLGVFDQALWLLAHGKAPFVTLIGTNIFFDHFSPVLVAFVPLYWIAATPFWLLLVQSLALGFGLLALEPLVDEVGLRNECLVAFVAAYVLSPLLWNSGLFDFHPTTLAVPLLLMGMTAALRDDRRSLALCSAGLLFVRFDLGLAVVALALLNISRSSHRRARYGLMLGGIVWVLVWGNLGIVGRSAALWKSYYGYLAPSPRLALLEPWHTLPRLVDGIVRGDNVHTVITMLLALGFVPLLSPSRLGLGFIWALPLLAASVSLAPGGLHNYQYGGPIFPFLLLAAACGVSRLPTEPMRQVVAGWVAVLALVSFVALLPVRTYIFDIPAPDREVAAMALAYIGPDDRVVASDTMGPHLSHRSVLLPFPYPISVGDQRFPLDESVTEVSPEAVGQITAIVVYEGANSSSQSARHMFFASPYLSEFQLVFSRDGLFVYRRAEQVTP